MIEEHRNIAKKINEYCKKHYHDCKFEVEANDACVCVYLMEAPIEVLEENTDAKKNGYSPDALAHSNFESSSMIEDISTFCKKCNIILFDTDADCYYEKYWIRFGIGKANKPFRVVKK